MLILYKREGVVIMTELAKEIKGIESHFGRKMSELSAACFDELSYEWSLSSEFVEKYKCHLEWSELSHNEGISEEILQNNKDLVHWGSVSENRVLSEEFMRHNKDDIDWIAIMFKQDVPLDLVFATECVFTWFTASQTQKITIENIESHPGKNNLDEVLVNPRSSEEVVAYVNKIIDLEGRFS